MRNDKKEVVALLFSKNALGKDDYVFSQVVYGEQDDYWKHIVVTLGKRQDMHISMDNCFSISGLYSKMKSDKPSKIVGKTNKADTDYLTIILDDEIRQEAYRIAKEKCGREPGNADFLTQLACLGVQIGKNIDHINKDGGKVTLHTKGNIDQISLSNEEIKRLFRTTFTDVKEEKRKAEEAKREAEEAERKKQMEEATKNVKVMSMNGGNNYSRSIPTTSVSKSDISSIDVNQIKDELKKKVIAQDETIDKVLNNIYFNQRIIDSNDKDFLKNKVNILLDGPTGTGKTLILEQIADKLSLPIVVTPITNYSTTGYRGLELSDILVNLLDETGGNLELAERGIVVLDEFDKLGSRNENSELSMRKALQQELLTYISGAKYNLNYRGQSVEFDTSKLTFIGLGAFNDLRENKISENERKHKNSMGFSAATDDSYERVYSITKQDYIDEGLQRELVGRFTCLASTNELGIDQLKRILVESSISPLTNFSKLCQMMGCNLVYNDEIVTRMAEIAYKDGCGARSLLDVVTNLKDVVSNDIINGNIKEINITDELLDKSREVSLRSYNARSL